MEISPTVVFCKTERGAAELKTRQHGLTPRLRQLLILIDGKRDVEEVARVLPQPELGAQLAQLESGGFIAASPASYARTVNGVEAMPPFGGAGTRTASEAATEAATAQATLASAADADAQVPVPAPASQPREDLRTLRARVTRALLETIGPNGDQFAIRLERARSVEELRALVPAVLSVVEAVGGRRGVDQFLERCGGV